MSEHCHCGQDHDHHGNHPANRYEEAFSKFNLQLNDEQVNAATERLVSEKKAQYDTPK